MHRDLTERAKRTGQRQADPAAGQPHWRRRRAARCHGRGARGCRPADREPHRADLPIGFRQRVRDRGIARRACRRAQFPAACALRPVCRAAVRHGVHGAARRQPCAPGSTGSVRRPCTCRFERIGNGHFASRFGDAPTPPNQLRWDPLPIPSAPTDFVEGMVTMAGNGDAASDVGLRHPRLRRQPLDGRPVLLRRRRRIADRAATGAARSSRPNSGGSKSSRRKSS